MRLRRVFVVAIGVLFVAAPPTFAARLWLDAGSITVFRVAVELPIVEAAVDIRPESLEKKSEGPSVTVFIEAADRAFDVAGIAISSIRLCQMGPLCEAGAAVTGKPKVDDADGDGVRDLKVTFDRGVILGLVADVEAPADVVFVVSGLISDGAAFSGTAQVKLVDPEVVAEPTPTPEARPTPEAEPTPTPEPAPTAEPTPEPTPTPEPAPTAEPTPEPTPTPEPAPTSEPTPEPTPAPEPAPEATPVEP